MFQLTESEFNNLKSHFATSSWGGNRKLPYAFTEQGVYMLATVLKGDLAIRQSIEIMRTFKTMRSIILNNSEFIANQNLLLYLDKQKELESQINDIKQSMILKSDLTYLTQLFNQTKMEEIVFFDGDVFDADLAYQSIFQKAQFSIFIIDDYLSINTLDHLRTISVPILLFSDNKSNHLSQREFSDFLQQFPNVNISLISTANKIHDRFIVIDYQTKSEETFHLGASIKDAGKKVSMINKIGDSKLISPIINKLLNNPKTIL